MKRILSAFLATVMFIGTLSICPIRASSTELKSVEERDNREIVIKTSKIMISEVFANRGTSEMNLIDGTNNKYECSSSAGLPSPENPLTITIKTREAVKPDYLVLYTGNDDSIWINRAPNAFKLYGISNDSETLLLDITDSGMQNVNFSPFAFDIKSNVAFNTFKLVITSRIFYEPHDGQNDTDHFQLGEIELRNNSKFVSDYNTIQIGDYITLGKYYGEPIVWRCVDIDENGPLMLSDKILCLKAYDAKGENNFYHSDGWGNVVRKGSGSNCWSDSSLRQWLNSSDEVVEYSHCPPNSANVKDGLNPYDDEAGFLYGFTNEELSLIKTVTQKIYINEWETHRDGYWDGGKFELDYQPSKNKADYSNYMYQNVTDRIFLLTPSQSDVVYQNFYYYFVNAFPTQTAVDLSTHKDENLTADKPWSYWLNIPRNTGASYENLTYVNPNNGSVGSAGASESIYGVRPAFYLNADNYFINNQSSEYSYLMGESWKNAGMENINEYLMTFPSISKAYVDAYNSNQDFLNLVAGWTTITLAFEPGESLDYVLSLKSYYSAILLSLIDAEIMNENYIESIKNSSQVEFANLYNQLSKIIIDCKELDHEKLLSEGTCSVEDITILNDRINFFDDMSSAISKLSRFLSTGKTINESINLCINYYNIFNTSKYIVNVLKGIRENSSDNMFLAMAVDDIIDATEDSFARVLSGFKEGTVNVVKNYGIDNINDAWQSLLESNTIMKGALLGYKVGKPLSNKFFNTDKINSNYFEFTALYEVEKALKATIKDFETDFYDQVDADSSLNYINAVSMYFKTYYLSYDYAIELEKYRNLCPFGKIFYNGKQSFEDANKQFNAIRSDIKSYEDQLFRLWTYSLKERYPEIYSEIAPSLGDIYSTDLSTALVRLEYLSKTYTGEEMKPNVKVAMGNAVLSPEEYTVSYYNNTEPGIATVKITAVPGSIYTGEKMVEFVIKESPFVKRMSIRGTTSQISLFSTAESGIVLPNVFFYENGKIVASVENGVITNDELPIFITENGIDALMKNKNYTVEISGNSSQIYNTEIQKLNDELLPTEKVNYNDLSINSGIHCNINFDTEDEIILNNEVLQPDFSTDDTADKIQYSIYSNQCVADSSAYEKQRVYISAIIPEGNIFVGWSVSPQVMLSSTSSVSSFIMPNEDVYINSEFIVNQSYFDLKNAINKAINIEYDKYTKASYENLQATINVCKSVLTYDISRELCEEKISELQTAINSLVEIQPLKFKGASLTLYNSLEINYKVERSLFEKYGYTNPYVKFTLNGVDKKVFDYTVVGNDYVFNFTDIAPHQMNDTIYSTLYANYNGEEYSSETKEYSVATYCYNMLSNYTSGEYSKLRTLLVDLLNYGAQSQIYTDYKTDNLATKNLTEAQSAWGTVETPELQSVMDQNYTVIDNPTVTWKGAGLNLMDSVTMRFKIDAESIDGLSVKVTSESGEWTIDSSAFEAVDDGYYIFFDGLNVGQMSEPVYLTVYDGNTAVSNTICYSIESYAYSKQNGNDENLNNLLEAMMKYGNSAYSYVH